MTNAPSTKSRPWPTAVGTPRLFALLALVAVVKLAAIVLLGWGPTAPSPVQAAPQAEAAPPAETAPAPTPANATTSDKPLPVRLQELRERELALDQREASLRALEGELDRKLQELKALQAQVQGLLDKADVLKDEKIRHLVDVYSNMKPQQAGLALEALDEAIAVKILAGMTGRKAGEILSTVRPDKAAKLSEALTRLQTPFGTQ